MNPDPSESQAPAGAPVRGGTIRRILVRVVFVVLVALLAKMFACGTYEVKGQSMWPTLLGGEDRVGIDKIAALIGHPKRFELWAFRQKDEVFVKRVLGLPGERIDFKGGDVFIGEDPGERVVRPPELVESQMIPVPADVSRFETKDGRVDSDGVKFALVPDPGKTLVATLVGPPGVDRSCIKDDHLGPDGRTMRGRCAVPDVRVTLGSIRAEGATLAIVHQLSQGGRFDHVRVVVDPTGVTVTARVLGKDSVLKRSPGTTCENGLRMETLDGMFRLLLPDGAGWRELFSESRETDWITVEGFSGIKFEATDGSVHVGSLEVGRDVHYVWGADSPSVSQPIPSDRLFMAGDNPEISKDSRAAGFGGVSKSDLVGRVRLAWRRGFERLRVPR